MKPEDIAAVLARAIREKVYPPGSALIQEELAARFKVSRSPVRDALRILAAQGVVLMPSDGSGATVRSLSRADLVELYELRLTIEPGIAVHLVANARPSDIDALTVLAEKMSRTTVVEEWMRLNYRFHSALYEMACRPRTEAILSSLLSAVQPYSLENVGELGGKEGASHEHHEMIAALQARDADRLAGLVRQHLQTAMERLAQAHADDDEPSLVSFQPLA